MTARATRLLAHLSFWLATLVMISKSLLRIIDDILDFSKVNC